MNGSSKGGVGAWFRPGGGQVVLEDPHPTHPMFTHPSSQNHSPILHPPALHYHVQDSGGVLESPAPSGFWGVTNCEDSPDLAWTAPHPGPAHLRPGMNLWASATNWSQWAERELGNSRALLPLSGPSELHSCLPASALSRTATGLPGVLHSAPASRGTKKDTERPRRGR